MKKRERIKRKAVPRPVDFANNPDDLEAALLSEAGWYVWAVADEVNMSEGQVAYRAALAGAKRGNYRAGKSDLSRIVLGLVKGRERVTDVKKVAVQAEKTFPRLQMRYVRHHQRLLEAKNSMS